MEVGQEQGWERTEPSPDIRAKESRPPVPSESALPGNRCVRLALGPAGPPGSPPSEPLGAARLSRREPGKCSQRGACPACRPGAADWPS